MSMSSNKFANGANQNSGNVITDRSSTRIHHAPGGASSICLGDGSSGGMFADSSAAQPAAQKRIHHAPGGASSICLGDGSSGGMFADSSAAQPAAPKTASHGQPVASQPTSVSRPMTPHQLYAEELRMQIEAKNALKVDKKAAALQAERADDARVQREAGQLRSQVEGEISKQRQRENIADQRSSQLASYLAQQNGPRGDLSKPGDAGVAHPQRGNENINKANTFTASESDVKKIDMNTVSSNRFANGANQNSGNMMTDRSTTRVAQAPGGRSSIVLG